MTREKLPIFILLNASHYWLKDKYIRMLYTDYTKCKIKTTSWSNVNFNFYNT